MRHSCGRRTSTCPTPDCNDPIERLVDALTDARDESVASMACRAPVNGRAATMDVLRHLGRHDNL